MRKPAFHQSGAVRTGLTNEDDPYTVESLMQKISADVQLNKARNTAQQETRMECGTSDGDNSTTHEEFPSMYVIVHKGVLILLNYFKMFLQWLGWRG